MIVRRIIENLKDRNWTTVTLELVVVVLGVFLGLQAQAWYEERGRRGLEAAYTERLYDDAVGLQERRARILAFREQWNAGLQSLKPALFGGAERPITAVECQSLAFAHIVTNPTDELASLMELQSSGRLSMFRNDSVANAIQDFLLTRARARDARAGIARNMPILPEAYPGLIRIVTPTDATADPPVTAEGECDIEGMRADRGFLNTFENVQRSFTFHVAENARVSESLAELRRALGKALGRTQDTPQQDGQEK